MKSLDADKWVKAMEFELNALNKMCIWDEVKPSANTNIYFEQMPLFKFSGQGM
jgi:hypothetical protein